MNKNPAYLVVGHALVCAIGILCIYGVFLPKESFGFFHYLIRFLWATSLIYLSPAISGIIAAKWDREKSNILPAYLFVGGILLIGKCFFIYREFKNLEPLIFQKENVHSLNDVTLYLLQIVLFLGVGLRKYK
jgi:hypothetical protein